MTPEQFINKYSPSFSSDHEGVKTMFTVFTQHVKGLDNMDCINKGIDIVLNGGKNKNLPWLSDLLKMTDEEIEPDKCYHHKGLPYESIADGVSWGYMYGHAIIESKKADIEHRKAMNEIESRYLFGNE